MDEIYVCHGVEEHSFIDKWKCEACRQVDEEFEQAMLESNNDKEDSSNG